MFLTKYTPKTELESLFDREFFPMMRGWFEGDAADKEFFRLPKTNIHETNNEFVLTVEMPGVERKNVSVSVENGQIVITGEKTEKTEEEGLLRREIRSEKFHRSFTLDAAIDRENIKAKLDNGILRVTLPKKAESVGRKIAID